MPIKSSINKLNAQKFLKDVPHRPGVYQMLNAAKKVLYVGKAKDLKKRLASYFRKGGLDAKTQSFLSQVADISITITSNETEALLLEYNLIKNLQPPYNIVFRDNRSYPYLFLSQHTYPALSIHRGVQKEAGLYFGPFTSGSAVHETLHLLQRIFKLRRCKDSAFKNRSRPCLQYQIKRCQAPCVGYIDEKSYARNVEFVRLFLSGKSDVVIEMITKLMQQAAANLDFESAAAYRDQLANLRKIQQQQYIIQRDGDIDIIAVIMQSGYICIDVLTVRNGLVLGNKTFVKDYFGFVEIEEVLTTFLMQYYLQLDHSQQPAVQKSKTILTALPDRILLDVSLPHKIKAIVETALEKELRHKIKILLKATKSNYKQWLNLAIANAEYKLQQKMMITQNFSVLFKELQKTLNLQNPIERIECFDVSHHSGEATVVSCVAFGVGGQLKDAYRKYNIQKAVAGDDYGALEEALVRHFRNGEIKKESGKDAARKLSAEVFLIDGGKGQLNVMQKVLMQLNINTKNSTLIAIAKGEKREWGAEKLYIVKNNRIENLQLSFPLFTLLLRVRDEAHRFAISAQRNSLRKRRLISPLESILGVGKKKRDLLLKHFGGLQGIKAASITELCQVSGINKNLATRIYEALHG